MENLDVLKEFIKPELLILIPVMYIIGIGIKKSSIKDNFIPIILGVISITLSALYVFATSDIETAKQVAMAIFVSITQGILIAGASVYFNQIYKQLNKK